MQLYANTPKLTIASKLSQWWDCGWIFSAFEMPQRNRASPLLVGLVPRKGAVQADGLLPRTLMLARQCIHEAPESLTQLRKLKSLIFSFTA